MLNIVKNITITKNKSFEFQLTKWENWTNYFNFCLTFNRRQDHAGLRFDIEILGLNLRTQIYDHRHWDYSELPRPKGRGITVQRSGSYLG